MTLSEVVLSPVSLAPCPERAFVGFSGGADSTALLLLLIQAGVSVTAVHFQHGIRGEAAEGDAVWCERFCQTRGITFRRENLAVPEHQRRGESLEEAARRLRLEAWRRLADQPGDVVFLAHHADDALEDMVLRLARGGNCTGLTGLRERRVIAGVEFRRPLLGVRKAALEKWLKSQGVEDWRVDATNADNAYRRNAVRNELLPLVRRIFRGDGGFVQSLKVLREDADYLESAAEDALAGLNDVDDWRWLAPALLPRVFRLWYQSRTGCDIQPTHQTVERLATELARFSGRPVDFALEGGVNLRLGRNGFELSEKAPECHETAKIWNWRQQSELQWGRWRLCAGCDKGERFAEGALPAELLVRSWRAGDRMVPFGGRFPKKLQDIFSDAKIPREERLLLPIVCVGEMVVWIPGVRRAEFGRVNDGDKEIRLGAL